MQIRKTHFIDYMQWRFCSVKVCNINMVMYTFAFHH